MVLEMIIRIAIKRYSKQYSDTHHRLVPRLRMSGVIPLLPPYAFMDAGRDKFFFIRKENGDTTRQHFTGYARAPNMTPFVATP
jgi:hypothetical protein